MNNSNDMIAIILAAGKGVRMRSELPKVLHKLNGKPLITHVMDNLAAAGIKNLYTVVGYKGESVIDELGNRTEYVWQKEQLGTGHAVMQAEEKVLNVAENVIVTCGDTPLISSASFSGLADKLKNNEAVVLTMDLDNPKGYGRIVKDSSGNLSGIVEEKDASDDIRKITEVNAGTYAFKTKSLFDALHNITNDNAQKEYYLTDVIKYLSGKGLNVSTCKLDNSYEGSGINSPEDLALLETFINSQKGV